MSPVAKSAKAKGSRDTIQGNDQKVDQIQTSIVAQTNSSTDNVVARVSSSNNYPSSSQSVKFVSSESYFKDGLVKYNRNEHTSRQSGYPRSGRPHSGTRWQARLKYLQQRAQEAVPALRIRGIDFMENLEEPVEITEDGERCLVQFPEEIFDALTEVLSNSNEITLIYRAMQPLVGMVFGKHGSAAHQLHEMGATLELASKDRFHIKCPHTTARQVQDFFEEKLAKALVRLNSDRVTVVMRPEKLMIMLSPFCLTPVVVLGLLTPHLLVMRIYDLAFEEQFAHVHKDMQAYYGSLSNNQLLDMRLSLPITIGSLACYFDDKSHAFVRVVVEEVMEPLHSTDSCTVARIWKMDYGSFECVSVDQLYRLQTCYLTVPRQCFVARLLYAKKQASCDFTVQDVYFRYFSSKRLFALSVMENPSDLSHVILFYRDRAPIHGESEPTPPMDELKDILPVMVTEDVYQVVPYSGVDFSSQLDTIRPLHTDIPYAHLCRSNANNLAQNQKSSQSNNRICVTAEAALQELVCPYERNPEKRFVFKYHGLNMSEEERALKMHLNVPSIPVRHTKSSVDVANVSQSHKNVDRVGSTSSSNYTTQEKIHSLESGGMTSSSISSMYSPLMNSFNMIQPQLSNAGGNMFSSAFFAPIWPNTFMNGMLYPGNLLAPAIQPSFSGYPTYLSEPWASVAAMMAPSSSLQYTPNYSTPWMFSMPSTTISDPCVAKELH